MSGNGCRVFKNYSYTVTQEDFNGHGAVDLVPSSGGCDFITAHTAGVVISCESSLGYNAQGASGTASYGNYVKIRHDNGYMTLYAHMEYISVGNGERVLRGQQIGYMGNTGNSYGAHLHFEVRTPDETRVDPSPYINADLPGSDGGEAYGGNDGGGSGGASAPAAVEITEVVVKSVEGKDGSRPQDRLRDTKELSHGCEILIQNGEKIMLPVLIDQVTVEWERGSTPGVMKFDCLIDEKLDISEGNPVSMRWEGKNIFYGYIFERKRSDSHQVSVTVYDQLRYLKNKGTISYEDKKYSELLKMLADDYRLQTGEIEDTGYVIEGRIEDGALLDILANAADETLIHSGKLFVLYDDFGKLTLKNIESMSLPLLIDKETGSSFDYTTSIDKDVYSKVILASDNDQTGERELYVANNGELQQNWGILQYYEAMNGGAEELTETARVLLKYYGQKRRSLKLRDCLGDIRVRGGSSLVIKMKFDDIGIQNYMVVDKVKHTFEQGIHTMDLDVSGINGQFVV